jgi:glycosyltransferase involved in cell wall biosynthesis
VKPGSPGLTTVIRYNSSEVISENKKCDYYSTADMFIVPPLVYSVERHWKSPVVLMGVLACSIPVIASDFGWVTDVMERKTD